MCQNKWDADFLWKELNANKRRTRCTDVVTQRENTQGRRNVLWLIAIHPPKKGSTRPDSLTVHTLNGSISMIFQGFLYLRYGWLFPPHPSASSRPFYVWIFPSLPFFSLYTDRRENVQSWNVASAFLLKQMGANIDFVSAHPPLNGRLTCALINCTRPGSAIYTARFKFAIRFVCLFFLKSELQPPAWIFVNSAMNHPRAAFAHTDESSGAIIFITQGGSRQLPNKWILKESLNKKTITRKRFQTRPRRSPALTDHWCPHLLPIQC